MKEIDCEYVDEHDLVAFYLAGKLTENDAETFEAHQIGCDRCSAELVRVGEIRAALGKPLLVPAPGLPSMHRFAGRDLGPLLAAAAAVAMVALGIREVARRPELTQLVYRGPDVEALRVRVSREPDGIRLSWTTVQDAKAYALEIVASDGAPVLKREVNEPTVVIHEDTFRFRAGISFRARVKALDSMGQVVATSDLTPLPVQ